MTVKGKVRSETIKNTHDSGIETLDRISNGSTAFMLEWLRIIPPPLFTGEQYGNIEPKYTENGHCQSVWRP